MPCILRSSPDIQLLLAATRHVQLVIVYNPRSDDTTLVLAGLTASLTITYARGIEDPEEEYQPAAQWPVSPGSLPHRVMQAAAAGAVHTLRVGAVHWAAVAQCIPALAGLQCLSIQIPEDEHVTLTGRAPIRFPSRDLRTLELAAASCADLWEMAVVGFVIGGIDRQAGAAGNVARAVQCPYLLTTICAR